MPTRSTAAPVAVGMPDIVVEAVKLSARSKASLAAAHPKLQALFRACTEDAKCPPFQILEARRGRKAQNEAYRRGNSRARFGSSPHNYSPAIALDITPVPLNWNDIKAFQRLGRFVVAKAAAEGIPIEWGGLWTSLKDFPHFELRPWRTYAKQSKLYEG